MATTTGYRHGVYTREVPTSLLPARSVDSAVVFAVGTAAVHKLGSDAKVPVNEPMLFYSYDEFVTAMGWDADNFSDYTLQELVYSHFALYRGAPIIAVNVFDPGRHRSEVSGESLTFKTTMLEDGTARLAHPGIASLVLSSPANGVNPASVDNGEADVTWAGLKMVPKPWFTPRVRTISWTAPPAWSPYLRKAGYRRAPRSARHTSMRM